MLVFDGSTWEVFSDANSYPEISDDTTTNATYYPSFVTSTSGSLTSAKISSTKLTFNPSTGEFGATNFNSLSDINFKHNINTIDSKQALDIVNKANAVSFNWNDNGNKAYGVIAQQIEELIPEIVTTNEHGVKKVSYDQLIPFLLGAVKELTAQINELKAK